MWSPCTPPTAIGMRVCCGPLALSMGSFSKLTRPSMRRARLPVKRSVDGAERGGTSWALKRPAREGRRKPCSRVPGGGTRGRLEARASAPGDDLYADAPFHAEGAHFVKGGCSTEEIERLGGMPHETPNRFSGNPMGRVRSCEMDAGRTGKRKGPFAVRRVNEAKGS